MNFHIKNNIPIAVQSIVDPPSGGAVVVAELFDMFDDGAFPEQFGEFWFGDKTIILAVYFPGSGWTGGVGDGKAEMPVLDLQALTRVVFPDPEAPETTKIWAPIKLP